MGDESLIAEIARLMAVPAASAEAIRLDPCEGGGNNRVFAFETGGQRLIAKRYFSHPSDRRDRLGAEYAFLDYARHAAVGCVPRPLARDPQQFLAVYERVPGRRLVAGEIGTAEVEQAADFFVALNRAQHRELARTLPQASEAGFNIAQHFAVVEHRIERLQSIPGEGEIDAAARGYVRALLTAWSGIRLSIERQLTARGECPVSEVVEQCVSPSDFGFHNALIDAEGRVRFIDFEYAGWDDPAKMAGDFFCQPAVPVPMALFEIFLEAAMAFSSHATELRDRARMLLPVFQVKWCCIMLNDFLPDAARRRRFADPAADPAARKRDQLVKAQHLLDSIIK